MLTDFATNATCKYFVKLIIAQTFADEIWEVGNRKINAYQTDKPKNTKSPAAWHNCRETWLI